MDDDIHVHASLKVRSKELTKKVMMIQESTIQESVVGVDEEQIVLMQSLYVQGNQSDIAMESLAMHGIGVMHPLDTTLSPLNSLIMEAQ